MARRESNPKQVTDAIQRVLSGDVNAYEVIYEACDRPLRSFLGSRYGRFGGNFIDEVAILTHEYVLTRLDKYKSDKGASFQTWLNWQSLRVADRVMAERYNPRFVPFDEAKHEQWATPVPGPAEEHETKVRDRLLWREYEALARDGRLSIALHDLEGLTLANTARRLGMPVIRVRRLLERDHTRMLRRLRRLRVRPVVVDTTPAPIWRRWDKTEPDDDWTASVTAVLPDGPDTLVGAAARDEVKEEPDN